MKMSACSMAFAIISALSGKAMALTCSSTPTPLKTINRCDTVRAHGGETGHDQLQLNGETYSLWSAPQTFDQIFTVSCTDSCGNAVTLVAEVDWDCVRAQPIAALGINSPMSLIGGSKSCPTENGVSNASTDFQKYIDTISNHEQIKPAGMPAPQQGIGYWDGDGN